MGGPLCWSVVCPRTLGHFGPPWLLLEQGCTGPCRSPCPRALGGNASPLRGSRALPSPPSPVHRPPHLLLPREGLWSSCLTHSGPSALPRHGSCAASCFAAGLAVDLLGPQTQDYVQTGLAKEHQTAWVPSVRLRLSANHPSSLPLGALLPQCLCPPGTVGAPVPDGSSSPQKTLVMRCPVAGWVSHGHGALQSRSLAPE